MVYYGAEKQWCEIISCHPPTRAIEGMLRDGGKIMVSLFEVPPNFRWPRQGETWTVERDRMDPNHWNLCARVHGRVPILDENNQLSISFSEKAPIEDMQPGEARIDAEVITDALGRALAVGGGTGRPELYVQPLAPETATPPYLWIQTGVPPNGWTLWFDDGS